MADKKTWPDDKTQAPEPAKAKRKPTFDVHAQRVRLKPTITDNETLDQYMELITNEVPPLESFDGAECTVWSYPAKTAGTGSASVGRRLQGASITGLVTRITLLTNGIVRMQILQPEAKKFVYEWILGGQGYWQ